MKDDQKLFTGDGVAGEGERDRLGSTRTTALCSAGDNNGIESNQF
jgi:hypothetical protein